MSLLLQTMREYDLLMVRAIKRMSFIKDMRKNSLVSRQKTVIRRNRKMVRYLAFVLVAMLFVGSLAIALVVIRKNTESRSLARSNRDSEADNVFGYKVETIHDGSLKEEQEEYRQRQSNSSKQDSPTNASFKLVTHDVIFAIEKQTRSKYGNIESQLQDTIALANKKMSAANILRKWRIIGFEDYDKKNVTTCPFRGNYTPIKFCAHEPSFVYILADEQPSRANSVFAARPSIIWEGYNGLFSPTGKAALAHELGHVVGLPDKDHVSIKPQNNSVNGAEYVPFLGNIMHNLSQSGFDEWDKNITDRQPRSLPPIWSTWLTYQPQQNDLKLTNNQAQPLNGVQVQVFTSDPSKERGGFVDTTAEYSGSTNAQGIFSLGSNLLGNDNYLALKAFLIKATHNNITTYRWLNFTDINNKYFTGQTTNAVYTIDISPIDKIKSFEQTIPSASVPPLQLILSFDGNSFSNRSYVNTWKGWSGNKPTSVLDLPNSNSVLAFEIGPDQNGNLRHSIVSGDGTKLYSRVRKSSGEWPGWETTQISILNIPGTTTIRDFDQYPNVLNQTTQSLLSVDGKTIFTRNYLNGSWQSWSSLSVSNLGIGGVSSILSYNQVMSPASRPKQDVLTQDGKTIYSREYTNGKWGAWVRVAVTSLAI